VLLSACGGGGSSSTPAASTTRTVAHDGPTGKRPISQSALGNEKLEQGELQAIIKSTLETTGYHWEVNCNDYPPTWTCTYFSREKILEEDAEGRGQHVILSKWAIDPGTGEVSQLSSEEVEGASY
jgi:hypothetical protein